MILFKKCAVAFFFLFFLHGISIGTRQQGISYNEPSVAEVGNLKDISPNKALTLSNGKIFIKCTSAPHFGNTMLAVCALLN